MVLNKRILRELKSGAVKYTALLLMVVLALTLAIGMGDWTKIIDKTIDESNAESNLEDGEFSLYVPLSARQLRDIDELGFTVEYAPYVDLSAEDGSTLRMFKSRKSINLLVASQGSLPSEKGQIFVEQLYASVHGLEIGSSVTLGGESLTVCGIGTFPDYCSVRKNLGDIQSDYDLFSVCAVTGETFDMLRSKGNIIHNYAYKIFGDADHEELRDYLAEMDFDENKIDNRYMKMVVAKYEKEKDALYDSVDTLGDAISGLSAGSGELYRSLRALAGSSATLADSAESFETAVSAYGIEPPGLGQGSRSISSGISAAASGAAQINDGFYILRNGVEDFRKSIDDFIEEDFNIDWVNLSEFIKADENPRITDCKDDCSTAEIIGLIVGIVLFALMAYIMAVFTKHRLERESGIIGVLMASGYKSSELLRLYLAAPMLVTAAGSLLGTVLGFAAAVPLLKCSGELSYYSVPEIRMAYSPVLLVYGLIMPSLVMLIVNHMASSKTLKRTPLSLLRNQTDEKAAADIKLPELSYVNSFRLRRIFREKRVYVTMFFGLWISILVVIFGISMYQMLDNYMAEGANVPYEYMTILAYPPDDVPKNCEEAYATSLSCDFSLTGGTLDVMLMGITDKSDYFPLSLRGNKNELYLSYAAAEKLGYAVGDKIVLTNELTGRGYSFKVKGLVDYNNTLTAFMSLENIRDKFELDDDAFNTLFSMKKPNIREGRISSQISRADLKKSSGVFYDIMFPMTIFMVLIGAMIFMLVMYLLMNVAIDRASGSVALLKIFGYTPSEISKLYLGGNFYAVAITTIISIPTCYAFVYAIFPFCVSNVAANIKAVYDIKGIIATVLVIMASYWLVKAVLVHKLNKMSLSQALKNRE